MVKQEPDDPIARQYNRWSYPDPASGVESRLGWCDPVEHRDLLWPHGGAPAVPDVLVAGCGTTEAVALAARNPAARVVGMDVSASSLRVARSLAKERGLDNLTLHHLPLERVASLEQRFHLIISGGVIHHLACPTTGLRALGQVLRPDGVMAVAVYRRHARLGLEMMRELFQRLGVEREPAGLGLVRATVQALPPQHPLIPWLQLSGEYGAHDSHLVDTYLNAREVSYTVGGVLELVASAGMRFAGWMQNAWYYPSAFLPPGHPLRYALESLPDEREIWKAMELFVMQNDHAFLVSHPDRRAPPVPLEFGYPALWEVVPRHRFPQGVRHPPLAHDPHDQVQHRFYLAMDGRRTVRQCVQAAGLQADPPALAGFVREFLRELWRKDGVYLRWP